MFCSNRERDAHRLARTLELLDDEWDSSTVLLVVDSVSACIAPLLTSATHQGHTVTPHLSPYPLTASYVWSFIHPSEPSEPEP